jgi:serine/threonine protein kinase
MPTVSNIKSVHSGLYDGFRYVHTLELNEPRLASGNFGDVYVCASINGASPALPQLVKILRDDGSGNDQRGLDTIQKLQQQIIESNARRVAAQQPRLERLPALRALPQFSFRGQMNGRQVLGYSATRLDTEGYRSFADIVGMETQLEATELYLTLSIEERIILAAEMAEGFQALSEMSFIHADINAPNLLIDIERCHLAIIDYDSGAVMDDTPTTFGKSDDWLAPEIKEQMAQQSNTVNVDGFTDRWAVFIGIHHLLFLGPPLFFFNNFVTSESVGIYLKNDRWPHIAPDHHLFNQQIESFYRDYLHNFGSLPQPLQKELSVTMNEGFFQPSMRTSYQQWALILRSSARGPEIASFTADRRSIVAGIPTYLSWSVSGAYQVLIDNGIGTVDSEGSLELYLTQTRIYTLTARTRQGEAVGSSLTVQVWPFPELRSIQIPSCSIDQRISLKVLPAALPRIHIPIELNVSVCITEPSLRANATPRFEAAQARIPNRFPKIQPHRELQLSAIFSQLKSRFTELMEDFR